jgi:MoxR-like ATPase
MSDPAELYAELWEEIGVVLVGNEEFIERLTVAVLTGGHVLLEGVPGVAKTTTANLFATASGLEYARIQMTPDLLPADITGTRVFRQQTGDFEIHEGPVFSNVVVADEINRATPKTQSALLEAMQDEQVTIDGNRMALPSPFIVVATQNPVEMEGVFALPEAQRDRFQMKLTVEIPERDDERALLDQFDDSPDLGPESIEAVTSPAEIEACQETVAAVHVAPELKEYVLDLVAETREHTDVEHGASPRASITFIDAAKGIAAIRGREYVLPDDFKELAGPVLAHRLVLDTDASLRETDPRDIIADILESVESPSNESVPENVEPKPADADGSAETTPEPQETAADGTGGTRNVSEDGADAAVSTTSGTGDDA